MALVTTVCGFIGQVIDNFSPKSDAFAYAVKIAKCNEPPLAILLVGRISGDQFPSIWPGTHFALTDSVRDVPLLLRFDFIEIISVYEK